jgi:hypothetical protein
MSFVKTGPGSSEFSSMYWKTSEEDSRVIDLIGTRAAAVPAASTSVNSGSSSNLILQSQL